MKNRNPSKPTDKEAPMFVTWHDDASKAIAFATAAKAMSGLNNSIQRTRGSDIYRDIDSNLSVRDEFSRRDYEAFRPDETVPTNPKSIIKACRNAHRRIGLISNIINLMSDFTIQGIHLTHPNRKIATFYNEWWNKVNGTETSGKFAKNIYRDGIAAVQRTTAKLKAKDIDNLQKGFATAADTVPEDQLKLEKNEIPWKYTFLNPLVLEPLGDNLAVFSGSAMQYALSIPPNLASRIKSPSTAIDKQIVAGMSKDVVAAIRAGVKNIPLDPKKVSVFHYKKDDWEPWADPILYSVMDDLILLNKMKLADLAALDGAVSHIRLWRIGNIEAKILPTPEAINRLADMLLNNVGGGAMDLIWGPELEIKETSTDVYKFLGGEKYGPVLNAIYAGLGIPPTLTGGSGSSGFTNNYISLQTLLQRLNYVRMVLVEFWEREIKLVQRAMGFRFPASIQFDRLTLTDEAAEKMLLIQLYDRNVITEETIQERFGEIPELERARSKREARERKEGKRVRKSGPWHNPEHEEALQKISLQTGSVTPSEVGLELKPRKAGEKPALDMKTVAKPPSSANPGVPGQGRPKKSADTSKRKKKRVLPRTASNIMEAFAWARKLQKEISEVIDPVWLQATGKTKMSALTDEEFNDVEKFKYSMLCSLEINTQLSDDIITSALNDENLCIPSCVEELCKTTVAKYTAKYSKEPSLDELRQIQASVVALYKGDFENGEGND